MTTTMTTLPGYMSVTMKDGEVERMAFVPAAGDAGYFGPQQHHFDGPTVDDDALWDAVAVYLEKHRTYKGDKFRIGWEG